MKIRLTNSIVHRLEPGPTYYDTHDSEVPGFLVRTQPSGKRIFHLRYTLPSGERRSIRVGDAAALTVVEARDIAKAYWAAAAHGDDPQAAKQQVQRHTLESFLTEVYIHRATHKTVNETVTRVEKSFPDLLKKPMDEISPMWMEHWRKARLDAGTQKSTVNRDITALRSVLSRALDWGFLESHPLARVKPCKIDQISKPRYLDPKELERLHKALDVRELKLRQKRANYNKWRRDREQPELLDLKTVTFADHLKPLVLLALNTGLRRGELFNLEWSDCDLKSKSPVLTVRGEAAKSGETRHVPLNNVALNLLKEWKAQTEDVGLVFKSSKTGGRFDNINKSWKNLMDDAKLTDFRFHDTRHHFASMLVQKGVDLNVVRELLGHSDLKLTLRYAHLAPRNAAEAVALLNVKEKVKKKTNKEPKTANKEEFK
jgi:integrase